MMYSAMLGSSDRHQGFDPEPAERVVRPVMYQSWNVISFLHWRYRPDDIRGMLPGGLDVDTFDSTGALADQYFQLLIAC